MKHLPVLALAVLLAGCANSVPPASPPATQGNYTPAGGPPTQDAATRSSPVVVGRPARVFIFASFGKSCEPVAAPQIVISTPPAKGDITFQPGQETTIQYSLSGNCIGQKATGTGVYYTARAGSTGTDSFVLQATLASGEVATRSFEVKIAE